MSSVAKIYLVGSGPSSADLLTLKAKRLLEKASVIIYDALVDESIHRLFNKSAYLVYVGKRAGKHALSQNEINALLIRIGKEYEGIIVRLKGGDPFVFGRGGEEMIALSKAGLSYEVIPGVTAGIAAPAYFGVPVTHRGISRSITLVTAFTKDGGLPDLDWASYAKLGGTIVFYMSMRVVPVIAKKLMEIGKSDDYPAAIISHGTRHNQKLELHTLADFQPDTFDYEAFSPGVFVVGEVLNFAKEYQWYSPKRLSGKRVLVTRSEGQTSALVELFQEEGAEAVVLPTLDIEYFVDNSQDKLLESDWSNTVLALTSPNGVLYYMKYLQSKGLDTRYLSRFKAIMVIGPATEQALRNYGIVADLISEEHTADFFAHCIAKMNPASVLLPTSNLGGDILASVLAEYQISLHKLIVYTNKRVAYQTSELESLLLGGFDWVTFCSSSAVSNFYALLEEHKLLHILKDIKLAAIGPSTAKTLEKYGFSVSAQPAKPSLVDLVASVY